MNSCTTIYKHTQEGLVAKIHSDQRRNSRRRGHELSQYDIYTLREWAKKQPIFYMLYDIWVASGYNRWSRPSFNRKNNNLPYSLNNIEIMTAYENLKLEGNNPKPIYRIDMNNGTILESFESIISAEKSMATQ
jgi:hypothetical protein